MKKKHPRNFRKALFAIVLIIFSGSYYAQNFNGVWTAKEYMSGTQEHFRFMWFSSDNSTIYANDKTITSFPLNGGDSKAVLNPKGHNLTNATISENRDLWIQGNYTYNNGKDPNYGYTIPQFETYDFKTKKFKVQKTDKNFISQVILSSEPNKAYAHRNKDQDEEIVEIQIDPFKITRTITDESDYIIAYGVSEDHNMAAFATTGKKKALHIIDLATGKTIKTLLSGKEIGRICFTSDGKFMLASAYATLYKIDTKTYSIKEINVDPDKTGMYVYAMSLHPNDRSVAISSKFGTSVVDTEKGTVKRIDKGQSMGCNFSPDGQYLVTSVKSVFGKTSCLRVFQDKAFANSGFGKVDDVETVKDIDVDVADEAISWTRYSSNDFGFEAELMGTPTETKGKTKKGYNTLKLVNSNDKKAFIVSVIGVSSKVKASKYTAIAEKMGDDYVKSQNPSKSEKSTWTCDGRTGTVYKYKKGNYHYEYRSVCNDSKAYSFIYVGSESDPDSEHFFKSISLKRTK